MPWSIRMTLRVSILHSIISRIWTVRSTEYAFVNMMTNILPGQIRTRYLNVTSATVIGIYPWWRRVQNVLAWLQFIQLMLCKNNLYSWYSTTLYSDPLFSHGSCKNRNECPASIGHALANMWRSPCTHTHGMHSFYSRRRPNNKPALG